MSVKEEATKLHVCGFNCAQSVLTSCREYTGLDDQTALSVAGGLGGGCRCDEICGAVSGGVIVLGLANPFTDAKDLEAKERIAALAKSFTAAFRERFGGLRCTELKGDKSNCPVYIEFAADLAESMITKDNK